VPAPAAVVPPASTEEAVPRAVKELRSLTVEFDFNSATVKQKYYKQLAEMAALIKAAPGSTVQVQGHTDRIGQHRPNLFLSQRRAQSVKDQLVRYGVDARRVSIKGYGYTRPKASNATSIGRQRNRRADAVINVVVTQ
jgi:OmpA-OmpF porin, OOP family